MSAVTIVEDRTRVHLRRDRRPIIEERSITELTVTGFTTRKTGGRHIGNGALQNRTSTYAIVLPGRQDSSVSRPSTLQKLKEKKS